LPLACLIDAASLWSLRMRTEKVLVWRASSVWADRANRTYPADRVCDGDGCDTRLSIYNGSTLCWQHEPLRIRLPRGRSRHAA
jgi:hypothetical protein